MYSEPAWAYLEDRPSHSEEASQKNFKSEGHIINLILFQTGCEKIF